MVVVTSSTECRLNEKAKLVEESRFRNLNTLMLWVQASKYNMTSVEWRLVQDAYDSRFHRSADMAFLFGFSVALAFRKSSQPRFTRLLRPLYAGCVGYDIALREANPCPALQCWNSLVMLQSGLGEAARKIHAPEVFYHFDEPYDGPRKFKEESPLTWAVWAAPSLLLLETFGRVFEGTTVSLPKRSGHNSAAPSPQQANRRTVRDKPLPPAGLSASPREPSPLTLSNELLAFATHCRFVTWKPISLQYEDSASDRLYGLQIAPFPFWNKALLSDWAATLLAAGPLLSERTRNVAAVWWGLHLNTISYFCGLPS